MQFLGVGADGGHVLEFQEKTDGGFLRFLDVNPDVRGVVSDELFIGPDERMGLADDAVDGAEQEAHREDWDTKELN